MSYLHRFGPLAACLGLSAAALALPFPRSGPAPVQPPDLARPPRTPPTSKPEAVLTLADRARVTVSLGQGVLPAGIPAEVDLGIKWEGLRARAGESRMVTLCVDRSGSMAGRPLRDAQAAARAAIAELTESDLVAVVSFSTRAGLDLAPTPATAEGRARAVMAIDGLEAGGGTNLSAGLGLATETARSSAASAATRRVVLLSDGVPTEGDLRPQTLVALATRALAESVSVTTVGVGRDSPGGLMDQVAVAGGSRFLFIRDTGSLSRVLIEELRLAGQVASHGGRVVVRLPPGSRLLEGHGAAARMTGDGVEVAVGDVTGGQTRHAMVRLMLPAARPDAVHALGVSAVTSDDPAGASDQLLAAASDRADEVATSRVRWVGARAEVVKASKAVRRAAEDLGRGRQAEARVLMLSAERSLKDAARLDESLRPKAEAAAAFTAGVASAPEPSTAANLAHQKAFDLAH